MSLGNQLAFCTVRIECTLQSGETSVGTGFFYHFCHTDKNVRPAIITNKHVVEGADTIRLYLTRMTDAKERLDGNNEVIEFQNGSDPRFSIFLHPGGLDLAYINLSNFLLESEKLGKKYYFRPVASDAIPDKNFLKELSAIEELVMVGYPRGIFDSVNNMPVSRSGITATHPGINYEGRPEFIIDMACFPGSSGSPVFLFNLGGYTDNTGKYHLGVHRIYLLGVLYAGPQFNAYGEVKIVPIPTSSKVISETRIPMNLGYVINSRVIAEWENLIRKQIN